jgi:uncharacterized protein (DUF1330 family)
MTDQAFLFVTATPNPNEPQAMQEYLKQVLPLLISGGGKLLGRGAVQDVIVGSPDYKMAMTMAFDDIEAAKAVFESEDYKNLEDVRDRGFSKIDIALAKSM